MGTIASHYKRRYEILTDDHLRRYWSLADGLPDPYRQFFKLLLLRGRHVRDLAMARWEHIYIEGKVWMIDREMRFEPIPLSDWTISIFEDLGRRPSGRVFADHRRSEALPHCDDLLKRIYDFRHKFSGVSASGPLRLPSIRKTIRERLYERGISGGGVDLALGIGIGIGRYEIAFPETQTSTRLSAFGRNRRASCGRC